MTDVRFCETNYCKLFAVDGILKTVTTTVAKEILTWEKQSLSALRYLATGNASEDLKFLRVTSQSTGIAVLEKRWLLGRQTVTNEYCAVLSTDYSILHIADHWLFSIAQYCPLTAQYCAVLPTDCSVLRKTLNWLLNTAQYCPLIAQYCAILSTDCSIYLQCYDLVSVALYCWPYTGAFKIRIFRQLANFQCPTKDCPTLYYILSL